MATGSPATAAVLIPGWGQRNFSRREGFDIAQWRIGPANDGVRYLAGDDHAFSFPLTYFERYRLQ